MRRKIDNSSMPATKTSLDLTHLEDAIICGIASSLPRANLKFTPEYSPETRRTIFVGDRQAISEALKRIYANEPVPALDVLRNIKSLRAAIYNMRMGDR